MLKKDFQRGDIVMVNVRRLKNLLYEHKTHVKCDYDMDTIEDSFDRLEDEILNVIEVLENLLADIKGE